MPSKPCIFPFTYGGVIHTNCTWYESNSYGRYIQPWCPTAVDEQGNYDAMDGEGAEGHCGGQDCLFPTGNMNYMQQAIFD